MPRLVKDGVKLTGAEQVTLIIRKGFRSWDAFVKNVKSRPHTATVKRSWLDSIRRIRSFEEKYGGRFVIRRPKSRGLELEIEFQFQEVSPETRRKLEGK